MRLPQATTPFEALAWAIIGQQISLAAAIALRGRFIETCGCRWGDLACFPDANAVLAVSPARLTAAGLSRSKAAAILTVAGGVRDGNLSLDDWWHHQTPPGMIRDSLLAVRGIGPWTADYALLRGFGHPDASLHGDVAVRRGLQALLGLPEKPTAAHTAAWLEAFSPWRTLVAAHLGAWDDGRTHAHPGVIAHGRSRMLKGCQQGAWRPPRATSVCYAMALLKRCNSLALNPLVAFALLVTNKNTATNKYFSNDIWKSFFTVLFLKDESFLPILLSTTPLLRI